MKKSIILNYGDSQGEVIDYVFFYNENYVTYDKNIKCSSGWMSGWSLRGLNKIENQNRLYNILYNLSESIENVFIFLTFGSVDIEWNLSYKRDILKENVDLEVFINEMCNTYKNILNKFLDIENELRKSRLIKLNIILCFPYVPLLIPKDYLIDFSKKTNTKYYNIIDHEERLKLWNIYCDKMIHYINTNNFDNIKLIDVREDFIKNGISYYMRNDIIDHHPDFVKTQHLIINKINKLNFKNDNNEIIKLKCNEWKKSKMYEHIRRPLK